MLLPILRLACIICCIYGVCYGDASMLCPRRGYVLCVCVFARMFVCASVCSFGCQLVSLCSVMLCPCLCFVWFLVLCCMLTTSNRPPLPCHLLVAVLESKGRCNSNGNSGSNEGRPYTLWPNLQTHISRIVNAAHDRRAPWV